MKKYRKYARYLGQRVLYTCLNGYSFTPDNASDVNRAVYCQANGKLQELRPSLCEGKTLLKPMREVLLNVLILKTV